MDKIIKYIICIYFVFGQLHLAHAQYFTSVRFPMVAFTYDFNTLLSEEEAYGPRVQLISNEKFFGKKTDLSNGNALVYSYGGGIGSYHVKVLGKNDDGMHHVYAMFLLGYKNSSFLEPFFGVYPGIVWGTREGFFCNPAVGLNVTAFHFDRNWNTRLLQTYVQARVEYNTLLSSAFLGGGLILKFE